MNKGMKYYINLLTSGRIRVRAEKQVEPAKGIAFNRTETTRQALKIKYATNVTHRKKQYDRNDVRENG